MKLVNYNDFWKQLYYIELDSDAKLPRMAWGGYDQDFEDSQYIFRWKDLQPNKRYGYIGHVKYDLGVVDIDLYKDTAPDINDLTVFDPGDGVLIIKSPAGGVHIPFLTIVDKVERAKSIVEDIDIKGEIAKGHVVLPKHNSDYIVANNGPIPIFSRDNADHIVRYNDDPVFTFVSINQSSNFEANYPLASYLDRFTGDFKEGYNTTHPIHGSSHGANFMVDDGGTTWRCWRHNVTGNLLHLVGIEEGMWECGEWTKMDKKTRSRKLNDIRLIAERRGYIGEEPRRLSLTAQ